MPPVAPRTWNQHFPATLEKQEIPLTQNILKHLKPFSGKKIVGFFGLPQAGLHPPMITLEIVAMIGGVAMVPDQVGLHYDQSNNHGNQAKGLRAHGGSFAGKGMILENFRYQ